MAGDERGGVAVVHVQDGIAQGGWHYAQQSALGDMVLDGVKPRALPAPVAVDRLLGLAAVGLPVAPVVAEDELGAVFQQVRNGLERVYWMSGFNQNSPGGYVRRGS